MNFKKFSLKEYIEHTVDCLYTKNCNSSVLLGEEKLSTDSISHIHTCQIKHIRANAELVSAMNYGGSRTDISFHDNLVQYSKRYNIETLSTENIYYKKIIDKKYLERKENDFYTYIDSRLHNKNEITVYRKEGTKLISLKCSTYYKEIELKNGLYNYSEIITRSTQKVTESYLVSATDSISIFMKKTIKSETGKGYIIFNSRKCTFNFTGEPCVLRFLNKEFVFNLLLQYDYSQEVLKVKEVIPKTMNALQKLPIYVRNIHEIMEYYKNNDF